MFYSALYAYRNRKGIEKRFPPSLDLKRIHSPTHTRIKKMKIKGARKRKV